MFDVDNFYEILNLRYCYPKTRNILYIFDPHGSKDVQETKALVKGKFETSYHKEMNTGDRMCFGRILAHDQEPLSIDNVYTYKSTLYAHEKSVGWTDLLATIKDDVWLYHMKFRCGYIPIITHSEKHSDDLSRLTAGGLFIDCYYWWHGMIARDWFRHWRWHPSLEIVDKSRAAYRFLLYVRATDGTRTYRKAVIEHLRKHQDQIKCDWDQVKNISSHYSAIIDTDDATDAAIHLVAETLFDTSKIYLTEKVFKPMVMSQPFVLFAPPGSLSYLRSYGFQTFDSVWDESYDLEMDHNKRLKMILNLIDDLNAQPQDKFSEMYAKALPIIRHNRERFWSDEFQDMLLDEVFGGMDQSIQEQEYRRKQFPGGLWTHLLNDCLTMGLEMPPIWQNRIKEYFRSPWLAEDARAILTRYPELSRYL